MEGMTYIVRRNFAQILKSGKVDYKKEYKKLYDLLFSGDTDINGDYHSTYTVLSDFFTSFYFHGTYLSLQEFDEENGFNFPDPGQDNLKIEDLIMLMEYFYNMLMGYMSLRDIPYSDIDAQFLMQHILKVCEAIGYKQASEDGFTVFVEKDAVATAVAESDLIPDDLSYKLITYDHHSMRGNIREKKAIILQLAGIIEGQKKKLHQTNPSLEDDLFFVFNNFNIRHNNCDPVSKEFKPAIAAMDKKELEKWYDETYQMCLLALMEIEQADRKPMLDEIKAKIKSK